MSSRCTDEQTLIQLIELFFGDLLMIEYFDDPLPIHPFLHKACNLCQVQLLPDKIFSTVSTNFSGYQKHNTNHNYRQQSQCWTQNQHGDKSDHNRKR